MANEIKLKRYEASIMDVINRTIVFEVTNEVAKLGRVTYAKLTRDLSFCKVYVECEKREQCQKIVDALNSITGLFRSKVCEVLDIYKTPKIIFEVDKTIDYAENIDTIIKNINKKNEGE